MARIQLTETLLRDAHQSLLATRLRTEDMLPLLPLLDRIGYWSLECWGGATFDACLRFLGEDPWERLRTLREHLPNTRLQMLLRGQNLVGYRHYADDLVDKFVERAAANGIDVFRVFDALNDVRNLRRAIEAVKKAGKHCEGTISYTVSPVHDAQAFVTLAKELEALGCDTICVKDMAGLLTPTASFQLVSALVAAVKVPIHLHAHATSGMAEAVYLKAVEAGAQILDVAASAMAGGTSQPPTESLIAMLRDTPWDTGLDLDLVDQVSREVAKLRPKYARFESPLAGVDTRVLKSQIPGGMASNLGSQLKELGALERIDEVLAEVPRVRADLGYPPLVTPTSQIVGTQAVLNVLAGERYKQVACETRSYLMGYYGRSPAAPDTAIAAQVRGGDLPFEGRPADLLAPEWEKAVKEAGPLARNDEDVLSFALFPQVAERFFLKRDQPPTVPLAWHAAVAAVLEHVATAGAGRTGAAPAREAESGWKRAGRWANLHSRPRGA